jgi:hypothetical protein
MEWCSGGSFNHAIKNGVGDSLWSEAFGVHRNMRTFVVRLASVEAVVQGFALAEDWALGGIRLPLAAVDQDLKRRFQKGDEGFGALLEEPTGRLGFERATAQGDDHVALLQELGDNFGFIAPKGRLAEGGEQVRDGCLGLGLQLVVGVEEAPAEALGQNGAHSGFARTHEANQDDAREGLSNRLFRLHGRGLNYKERPANGSG